MDLSARRNRHNGCTHFAPGLHEGEDEQEKRKHSDILRKTFEKIEITKDRHILCDQIIDQLSEIVKFNFACIEFVRGDKRFLYEGVQLCNS